MPINLKGLFSLVLILPAFALFAQKEKDNRITIRGGCTVPHPLSNGAFKKSLTGIYYANFSAGFRPFSHFYIGGVYHNGLFKTAANKIAEVNTALQVNSIGARVGYDHFISDVIFFSPALNVGRTYGRYTGVICKPPQEVGVIAYNANYIEPELNLYFIVDPNFAIGINLSNTLINHTFDPYAVCFNQYESYSDTELRGNSVSINFGFGFYYGFWGGAKPSGD